MAELITQMIDFPSNEHTTPGYLARLSDAGMHPGVVVIQEWWGLVPHIKEVVERLARAGFVALAPDLYHGQTAAEPDEARKLVMELDIDRALAEIRAAANYLQRMDEVSPKKIGVVGWCMGGRVALNIAVTRFTFIRVRTTASSTTRALTSTMPMPPGTPGKRRWIGSAGISLVSWRLTNCKAGSFPLLKSASISLTGRMSSVRST